MLVGSDRCLGEIVSEMQSAVEASDPEDGQVSGDPAYCNYYLKFV
jgi:hypothetical protein